MLTMLKNSLKNIIQVIIFPIGIGFLIYKGYKLYKSKNINIISSGNITVDNSPEINKENLDSAIDKGKSVLEELDNIK